MTQRVTSVATLDAALRSFSQTELRQLQQALRGADTDHNNVLSHHEVHQADLPARFRSIVQDMENQAVQGYSILPMTHARAIDFIRPRFEAMNDVLAQHGLPRLQSDFLEGVVQSHYRG